MGDIYHGREAVQRAADGHTAAADYLRAVPESNEGIMASLESLGPVYAGLREEARSKLAERKADYHDQAASHENAAAGLQTVNTMWDNHEQDAQGRFRNLTENL